MEYGSDRYRLTQTSPSLQGVGGTIVAVCDRQLADGILHAVELSTGRTFRADAVKAFAVGEGRVVAAPLATPERLRTYALPALTVTGEVDLGAAVSAVAVGRTAVAAAVEDGVLLLGAAADGEPRRVAVEAPRVLAFSPDGALLAVGTAAGRVVLVDVARGVVARTLLGGRAEVGSLAWSADGVTVAAAAAKSALVWPSGGGKVITVFKAKNFAVVVGFHGRLLVVHDPQNVLTAVDVDTQRKAWELPQYGPAILRGDRVIAARAADVREIDARTGAIRRRLDAPSVHLHSVEASADTVVLGMSTGTRLVIGDLASGTCQEPPAGHEEALLAVHFAGDRFATGAIDTRALVWARGQATPLASVVPPSRAGTARVHAVHLEGDTLWAGMGSTLHRFRVSDGAWEASAKLKDDVRLIVPVSGVLLACVEASRQSQGEIALLDPVTLEVLHREPHTSTFLRASVQGARARLYSGRYWTDYDVTARAVLGHGGGPEHEHSKTTALSGDGGLLVEIKQRDDQASWWSSDVVAGTVLVNAREMPVLGDYVRPELAMAVDQTGARLATAHRDARVRVWDARGGGLLEEIDTGGAVSGVCWFPDGGALLVWNASGTLLEVPVAAR
jgi:hypothetical protein